MPSRLYIVSCVALCVVVLILCLLAAHGCAGSSQVVQPDALPETAAQGTVEMAATIDLGVATIDLQADALVAPPVEVSVCVTATIQALAVLRVEVWFAWEIVPAPATWHLCVRALGLKRCLDG